MSNNLLDLIKSRGHWRINFQPLVVKQRIPLLGSCKDIVEKNIVELRGWDYPYFPNRKDKDRGLEPGSTYYEGWVNIGAHKEFWRFFQSGQFIHYLALREDWMAEDTWYEGQPKPKPGQSLSVTGTVFQLTEIFEFLSRLAKAGIYEEGVRVSWALNNTHHRCLWINDPNRIPFLNPEEYQTGAQDIPFEKEYSKNEILVSSKELALFAITFLFDRFGWHSPNKEMIKKDQENLLAKRI